MIDGTRVARQIVEEPEAALLVLRVWFEQSPCRGIADFMWSLHESLPFRPVTSPTGKRPGKNSYEDAWEALAKKKDPADLPVLLGAANPSRMAAFHKRLSLLAKVPPDPRITIYLEIQAQNQNIDEVDWDKFPRIPASTPPEVQEKLDHLAPYLRQARQKFEELAVLLEAVGREPDAIEPRLVLVDHMLEKGDNRALYLREWMEYVPQAAKSEPKDPYHDAWIDNLPGLMDKIVRFKQGLPYYAGIRLVPGSARRIRDCVWWTTLEEVGITHEGKKEDLLELLAPGAFPALHTLTNVNIAWELPYRPGIRTIRHAGFIRRQSGHRILDLAVLPDLDTIEGSFEAFPELCELARGTHASVVRSTVSLTGASISAHDLRGVPENIQRIELLNPNQRLLRNAKGELAELTWEGDHMGQLVWLLTILRPIRLTSITLHFTTPPEERPLNSVRAILKDFPHIKPVMTGLSGE